MRTHPEPLTRRAFLARLGATPCVVALSACRTTPSTSIEPRAIYDSPPAPTPSCDEVFGLSEAELTTRERMGYVSQTPRANQRCGDCALFRAGSPCGSCVVVKGPIVPEGWCRVWARAPS